MKARATRQITSFIIAALLAATQARAQAPDLQALPSAQALYDEAARAMKKGDYKAACPMLEEVVGLVPEGLGAKRALAECYEGSGRLASAWTLYRVIASAATDPKWVKFATGKAEELRPKLSTLTLDVPEEVRSLPGLEIQRDGVRVGEPQWGKSIPVDRGDHTLLVRATGMRQWERTVTVDADGTSVDVVIGPLEDEAKPAPKPLVPAGVPAVPKPKPKPKPQPDVPPVSEPSNGRVIAGFVVGGIGVAGLAVGGVAGGLAAAKKGVVSENCPDLQCKNAEGWAAVDAGKDLATVSTVGFAVGLTALATGAVIVLTAPDGRAQGTAKVELRAGVLGDGVGASVKGAF